MVASSGFAVRISILVVILIAVSGLFAYDWYVMVPKGNQIIEELGTLSLKSKDETSRADVQKVIGRGPIKTTAVEGTELVIEEYRMPRVLPFQQGTPVWVVFKNGTLFKFSTQEQTRDTVMPKVVRGEFDPDNIPFQLGGMGGPPPSRQNDQAVEANQDEEKTGDEKTDEGKKDGEGNKEDDAKGEGESKQADDAAQGEEGKKDDQQKDDGNGGSQGQDDGGR